MELTKTKYKQTEVGLIPEDWELKKINEISSPVRGGSPRPAGSPKYFNGNFIPWLTVASLTNIPITQLYVVETSTFLTEAGSHLSRKLEKGTLIIANSGATLGVAKLLDITCCANDGVAALLNIQKEVHPSYLVYFINSITKKLREDIATGNGQPNLNTELIGNINIPLPPTLTEQKAIATALSDVDALISNLERLITKKKAIKQGAMQELLTPPQKGGKRLPGYSGDWERVKVEKVIDVARGGSPRPIQDYITSSPEGINWIKIGDTSPTSKYIISSGEKIIPDGANFSRRVYSGDFLLSNSMSFGRPYILKIDGCIHDGWLVLQNYSESFDREFLYYTLMSKDVFNQYLSKASGSGVLNLNKELVKVVELNRPKDLEEQKAIAQILSDMDLEIEGLEAKKAKYQGIKQGMMQELLTGKTRLV